MGSIYKLLLGTVHYLYPRVGWEKLRGGGSCKVHLVLWGVLAFFESCGGGGG